jgi:hypothetical protein
MTREQAIEWLRAVGRKASARDWAMGKTILVLVGEPVGDGDLSVYPAALYLYPAPSGRWRLWDRDVPDPAAEYDDLESAVRAAHEYVSRMEQRIAERRGRTH